MDLQKLLSKEDIDNLVKYKNILSKYTNILNDNLKHISLLLNNNNISNDTYKSVIDITNHNVSKARYVINSLEEYDLLKDLEEKYNSTSSISEHTYRRSIIYNIVHRSFGRNLPMIDIDCVDFRFHKGKLFPVLVIDTKYRMAKLNKYLEYKPNDKIRNLKYYYMISKKLEVPLWYVGYFVDAEHNVSYSINDIRSITDNSIRFIYANCDYSEYKYIMNNLPIGRIYSIEDIFNPVITYIIEDLKHPSIVDKC